MNIPANLQRRPFLAPIGLLAGTVVAAVSALMVLIAAAWWLMTSTPTTIIVVRHAPQVLGDGADDPPLSAEGEVRAAALAQALGDTRISAIYLTADRRSRSTAAPLAQHFKITPQVLLQDDAGALARQLLSGHAGRTLLVIGHAGTIPAIVSALSGVKDIPPVAGADYATLYVVTVPAAGRATVLRLSY